MFGFKNPFSGAPKLDKSEVAPEALVVSDESDEMPEEEDSPQARLGAPEIKVDVNDHGRIANLERSAADYERRCADYNDMDISEAINVEGFKTPLYKMIVTRRLAEVGVVNFNEIRRKIFEQYGVVDERILTDVYTGILKSSLEPYQE
jgi:hypothetical protein